MVVRDGRRVTVYLDGRPEISADAGVAKRSPEILLGGTGNDTAGLEGKLDEVADLAADWFGQHLDLAREATAS